jgi:DNA-binding SARP family transcriptional activator/tetratricopeptide (TPR) repeat protein
VELRAAGGLVDAGPPRQVSVLAALAVDAGRPVLMETLIDRVWGTSPPERARDTLYVYVARIRQTLAIADPSVSLVRRSGSYQLDAAAHQIDMHQFQALLGQAREPGVPDAEQAELIGQALRLWHGPPLGGLNGDWAQRIREAWHLQRIEAARCWVGAQVRLGRPAEAIGPVSALAGEYPLVESLFGELMRILYAAGRGAEALDRYAQFRQRLAAELGTDPGAELQAIHQSILRGARDHTASRPSPDAIAAQLPLDLFGFVGRTTELAELDRVVTDGRASVLVLSGMAGVGKTALAVHWAHRMAERFPDGALYVNLRGFDLAGQALDPAEAIRGFLDALGVPASGISRGLDAQVAQYRSLISGRRLLIVLDNARDANQIRPLLPGTPTAVVIVTSRNQLTGLVIADGAYPLTLDVMSPAESHELLLRRLGPDRMRHEAHVAEQIIALCAGLPLALAIVGARTQQTGFPLEALAAEHGPAGRQLDVLDAGDPATRVRAVFSWSYRALTTAAGRLYRLLGLHPGVDIGVRAAASLAGVGEADARELLAELARASLLAEHSPGRYAQHDLLRAYAAELVAGTDAVDQRRDAFARLVGHYLHTAVVADRQLSPSRRPSVLPVGDPSPAISVEPLSDALAWFTLERPNLLAVLGRAGDSGLATQCWQLAWAADSALELQAHWQDFADAWQIAQSVAAALPDSRAQAFACRRLAYAYLLLGRDGEADAQLSHALRMYEEAGDLIGQSVVHHSLSYLYDRKHDLERALHHAERALACSSEAGDTKEQATALNAVGWCHAQLGNHAQALVHCQRALPLIDLDNHRARADTWDSVGFAYHHLGELDRAADAYEQALALARQAGARHLEATVLTHLGDNHRARGCRASARAAWRPALEILVSIDATETEEVSDRLAAAEVVFESDRQCAMVTADANASRCC